MSIRCTAGREPPRLRVTVHASALGGGVVPHRATIGGVCKVNEPCATTLNDARMRPGEKSAHAHFQSRNFKPRLFHAKEPIITFTYKRLAPTIPNINTHRIPCLRVTLHVGIVDTYVSRGTLLAGQPRQRLLSSHANTLGADQLV